MERHVPVVSRTVFCLGVVSMHFLDRQPAVSIKQSGVLHEARSLGGRTLTGFHALPELHIRRSEDARTLWLLAGIGNSARSFPVMSDIGMFLGDCRSSMEARNCMVLIIQPAS